MTSEVEQATVYEKNKSQKSYLWFVAGVVFAFLWASASTATKIGLGYAQPLVIGVVRFGIAAACMLTLAHAFLRQRLPVGKEWKQLTIYGLLNITIYLGFYVVAMQTVTAGIGALAVASNPIFISFISVFFLREKITSSLLLAIVICAAGVLCAAWPFFDTAAVTTSGLFILFAGMLSYSGAAIYFATRQWNGLHLLTINGWQTAIGGLMLLPLALVSYNGANNQFTTQFWSAVLWLAVPVSIVAVQLWLRLLQKNATRAGLWLFLCPVFGFAIARWLVKESLSGYTVAGVSLVIMGLGIAQRKNK